MQVVYPDGLALCFTGGTDSAVVLGRFGTIGQHLKTAAKVLNDGQVIADAAAFFRTMQKLGQGNRRDCHAAGVSVEGGQYFDGTPLQDVYDYIDIKKVT